MQGACFELTTLPRTISGTAPRPCFAALSRVQRTCADLPQNQADSRCRPNAATLSAVHKKVQGRPCIATAACAPNGKKVAKIAMPRGSKPGERRGGRQPGTPNKTTALINTAFAATTSNPGLSPLDFFFGRDERSVDTARLALQGRPGCRALRPPQTRTRSSGRSRGDF